MFPRAKVASSLLLRRSYCGILVLALLMGMGCAKKQAELLPKCDPPNVRTQTKDSVTCTPALSPTATGEPVWSKNPVSHGDSTWSAPGSIPEKPKPEPIFKAAEWDPLVLPDGELIDAPATQENFVAHRAGEQSDQCNPADYCTWPKDDIEKRWICADKSRILLTAEDGAKHCLKFTAKENR